MATPQAKLAWKPSEDLVFVGKIPEHVREEVRFHLQGTELPEGTTITVEYEEPIH